MKVAVANVGIAIAANPTILAPRGVLEQRRPAASAWPQLRIILTVLGIAAAAAASFIAVAPAAHADTECGYARPGVRVEAGENTSCPFAINVANAMMNGGGTSFNAYSPTNGQTYWMHCMIEGHGSTTCRGGDNAEVTIY
jgi:hypothetical protein